MKIYYREKSGGIEILRCFGMEGRVEIPGMIENKLVISAAPYAFSSHMDEKEELKNASLWEVEYSCAMKSHFRKFGNQMSGSGNHLCNYASLLA